MSSDGFVVESTDPGRAIVVGVLAVAYAAFCIWLMVRIINRRERWAKWTLAAILGYPVLLSAWIAIVDWLGNVIDLGH